MNHSGLVIRTATQFPALQFNSIRMYRPDAENAGATIHYDRLTAGKTSFGCVGLPPTTDVTPPTVPTNFTVTQ